MKNLIRTTAFIFSIFTIIFACTKEIELKTEVEFSVTEQHKAEGYINEDLLTTITVVPEEILEEFSYSYSYSVSKGEGHFRDRSGSIFPKNENIPLNPFSASMMYVGTKAGDHLVKIVATDNYGFTEEVEIDYIVAAIPPMVWTATSPVKRVELVNSAQITVNFEKSDANTDVNYERRYRVVAGSGSLIEGSTEVEVELNEFQSILPGTYILNFTPRELGVIELFFDLKGDDGKEFTAELSFEVLEEIVDTVIPEITMLGDNPFTVQIGSNYKDPGAQALDDVDGDISGDILADTSEVDMSRSGTYTVTYNVSDSSGNAAVEIVRMVEVITGDNPQSPENDILSFAIPGQQKTANIDATDHTVTLNVPSGTETNVSPIALSVSPDASVSPSQNEPQNFKNPITYIVTAENGDQQEWTVEVNVAASADKSIEKFTIAGVEGAVSGTEISVTLPAGSDASSLTPSVQFIGTSLSPQSGTTVDFTYPATYTVTAEDGSTQEYRVTVIIEKSGAKNITDFEIDGIAGVFNGTNINVTLPAGNDEKSLSPTIGHTGESISPDSGSVIDFTNPVTFTVTAEDGTQKTYNASVIVSGDRPTANASANPMTAFINQDVNFTGSASTDDVNLVSYAWNFDDGNTSTSANPVHRYTGQGDYTVTLTVTDDGGLTDTASLQIEVPNQAPEAVGSANPTNADTGETINFTGSASSDDAGIFSYLWEFGDGNTSNAANPMHSYVVEGNYSVKLTITDNQGLMDTANINITVKVPNRSPIAVASSDKTSGPNILTVNFNGSGSSDPDGDTLSYIWNFGDGNTSNQRNPSHNFDVAGNYDVKLSVSDGPFTSTDNVSISVSAFNRVTGRYSAPVGSLVTVKITSIGGGKGSANLQAHAGSGRTGNEFMSLNTSWNGVDEGSTFLDEDENSFIVPSSGFIYFYGRHNDVIYDSQTYVTFTNNQAAYSANGFLREDSVIQE